MGSITWGREWAEAYDAINAAESDVWPSELDLMGRLAGLHRQDRWAGWDRAELTSDSPSQVAVYEKVA
jgi:hypothetical protein